MLSGGIVFAVIICVFEFIAKRNERIRNFFKIPVQENDLCIRRRGEYGFDTSRKRCSDNGIDT